MTIGELKKIVADLPDGMPVMVYDDSLGKALEIAVTTVVELITPVYNWSDLLDEDSLVIFPLD